MGQQATRSRTLIRMVVTIPEKTIMILLVFQQIASLYLLLQRPEPHGSRHRQMTMMKLQLEMMKMWRCPHMKWGPNVRYRSRTPDDKATAHDDDKAAWDKYRIVLISELIAEDHTAWTLPSRHQELLAITTIQVVHSTAVPIPKQTKLRN